MIRGLALLTAALLLAACGQETKFTSPTAAGPVTLPAFDPNATPRPDEPVYLGPFVAVQPSPARYVTERGVDANKRRWLNIRDTQTAISVRLGDDAADASLEALTDRYVLWRYDNALHAYDLQAASDRFVHTGKWYMLDAHIDGDWVTYLDNSDYWSNHSLTLRVLNLATGETLLLSDSVPLAGNIMPRLAHALNGGVAAWSQKSENPRQGIIGIDNLVTRQMRKLIVPAVQGPYRFSASANYVVWEDVGRHGYDLATNALFTIQGVPPGWEQAYDQYIVVDNDRLEWRRYHADPSAPFFVTALLRNR